MLDADTKFPAYLKAFYSEWGVRMSGSASVPFVILALYVSGHVQKILYGCLAVLCLIFASYLVWRNERTARLGQILVLENRIAELSRKPYSQDLEETACEVLDRMTSQGLSLLRHLLMREPLDVQRRFTAEIPLQTQFEQMSIAEQGGIVKRNEKWRGPQQDADYFVNPQFRPVLETILYERAAANTSTKKRTYFLGR